MSRSIRHGSSWPAQVGESGAQRAYRALDDLRFSAAETLRAEAEGRRVRPQRVRPGTANPCRKGRCGDFTMINSAYATAQSSVRTLERAALGELRKAVNAGGQAAGGVDSDIELEVGFGDRANGRRAGWW